MVGLRRVFAVLAMLGLVGCAAPEIPFDRAAAGEIKTIGIVTPAAPEAPSVVLASSVGQSFGLIGALVDAGMQASRESTFKDLMAKEGASAPDAFLEKVKSGLEKNGYTITLVSVPREQGEFVKAYPTNPEPKVDAYLDLMTMKYGYVAAGISSSTPYRPAYTARARLVSAKTASVLMQDAVSYNPIGPTSKIVTIPPDPAYGFKDFDALTADPDRAAAGLRTAAEQSGQTLADLLK